MKIHIYISIIPNIISDMSKISQHIDYGYCPFYRLMNADLVITSY